MDAYQEFRRALVAHYGQGEGTALALRVLQDVFGLSRVDVYLGKVNDFPPPLRQRLADILARLLRDEPVQYVVGWTEFCGLRLAVSPAVLIPRPETQELVALALERLSRLGAEAALRVLDVGTGSGCIALALADALRRRDRAARVEAWDVSPEALAVARSNAARLGLDVALRRVDVLSEASTAASPAGASPGEEGLDLIVSNPPYVRESERAAMAARVADHEPSLALFVPDDDALVFYRALCRLARGRLRHGGRLLCEVNAALASQTAALLRAEGLAQVCLHPDQFGRERMVEGVWP